MGLRIKYGWFCLLAFGVLSWSAWGAGHHSVGGVGRIPTPPGVGQNCSDPGGGGQPDPLDIFNQHVELADQELYLLKGNVVFAPGLFGSSRRMQPYFNVDLESHPWLAGKRRRDGALYLIEGTISSWRAYEGSYGELAAVAHVQVYVSSGGNAVQVISLKPVPELSSIPPRP